MPEIDSDLARLLALVGLLLIALLLAAMLVSLARLRAALERMASDLRRQASWRPVTEPPETIEGSSDGEHELGRDGAASESSESPAAGSSAATATHESDEAVEPEPTPEPEPTTQSTGAPQADSMESGSVAGETAAAEPQEQPFERDGRWWFRRGEELLVYDERSGRWDPAPVQSAPSARTHPAETQPEETAGESSPEASHGFWTCSSCGAVNGSTATTCRMCFAARP